MVKKNLSYKQLQEELEKKEKELEIVKSVLKEIQETILKYTGLPKDMPLIILKPDKEVSADSSQH